MAEGVEDKETWDILRAFGCDQVQGFLVGRPLAADRFLAWLQRHELSLLPDVRPERTSDVR